MFGQITIDLILAHFISEFNGRRGEIFDDPREEWVLTQVVEAATSILICQHEELHIRFLPIFPLS
jgi:hypothetical protein